MTPSMIPTGLSLEAIDYRDASKRLHDYIVADVKRISAEQYPPVKLSRYLTAAGAALVALEAADSALWKLDRVGPHDARLP